MILVTKTSDQTCVCVCVCVCVYLLNCLSEVLIHQTEILKRKNAEIKSKVSALK